MTYQSTQSDHYLSYLILRGKQKKKKKQTRIQSSSPFLMVGTKMAHRFTNENKIKNLLIMIDRLYG